MSLLKISEGSGKVVLNLKYLVTPYTNLTCGNFKHRLDDKLHINNAPLNDKCSCQLKTTKLDCSIYAKSQFPWILPHAYNNKWKTIFIHQNQVMVARDNYKKSKTKTNLNVSEKVIYPSIVMKFIHSLGAGKQYKKEELTKRKKLARAREMDLSHCDRLNWVNAINFIHE